MGLLDLGLLGIIVFIVVCLILIPAIIVGIGFANLFGFTGLTWWAFLIIFYLVISAILGVCVK